MSATMRAKMRVVHVESHENYGQETISMVAVARNEAYPEDGSDENNTFAKFTPMADLKITIQNSALLGKYPVGKETYVDFIDVEE